MKRGRWLGALLLPTVAAAWEEEPALAFILAYHPVVTAQRAVATAYQPPTWTRRVMEHTSVFFRAASGTSSTVAESGDTTTSSLPARLGRVLSARAPTPVLGAGRYVRRLPGHRVLARGPGARPGPGRRAGVRTRSREGSVPADPVLSEIGHGAGPAVAGRVGLGRPPRCRPVNCRPMGE